VLQPLGPATVPVVPSLVAGEVLEGSTAGPEGALAEAEPGGGPEGLTGAEPESATEGGVAAAGGGDDVDAAAVALGDQAVTPFVIAAPDGDLPDAPPGRGDRQDPGDGPPAEGASPDLPPPPRDEPLGATPPDLPPAERPPGPQGGVRPRPGPTRVPAADEHQRDYRAPEVELSRLLAERESLPELSSHLAVWWETGGAAPGSAPGAGDGARRQVWRVEEVDARWAAYPDLGSLRDGRDEATLLAAVLVLGVPLGGGGPQPTPEEPPASRARPAGRPVL
jgi:hypothetical protein